MQAFRFSTLVTTALLAGSALLPVTAAAKESPVVRGAYLSGIMGCGDCHMPMKMGPKGPEPDLARGLSGHPQDLALPPPPAAAGPWIWGGSGSMTAFYGPWGITYSANLTPDKETGIGSWTYEQFSKSMRTGKHLGVGRPIMPPMPWQSVNRLSERDMAALFRYLMAQPPVKNAVPAFQPARG